MYNTVSLCEKCIGNKEIVCLPRNEYLFEEGSGKRKIGRMEITIKYHIVGQWVTVKKVS